MSTADPAEAIEAPAAEPHGDPWARVAELERTVDRLVTEVHHQGVALARITEAAERLAELGDAIGPVVQQLGSGGIGGVLGALTRRG